jgi:hypothetical protein
MYTDHPAHVRTRSAMSAKPQHPCANLPAIKFTIEVAA